MVDFNGWTDEQVNKVFDFLLDDMAVDVAERLRADMPTRDNKISYFMTLEILFEKSFE